MNYKVEIEGFEGQVIEVVPPGFFSPPRLLVNGEPAPKHAPTGSMILIRNDAVAVEAKWIPTALGLDMPFLSVGGQVISFAERLQWYQWVWAGWSVVVLVLVGNVIGLFPGLLAMILNIQVFRSRLSPLLKYLMTLAISLMGVLLYRAIALYIPRLAELWQ
jgi:hypothetical protein